MMKRILVLLSLAAGVYAWVVITGLAQLMRTTETADHSVFDHIPDDYIEK